MGSFPLHGPGTSTESFCLLNLTLTLDFVFLFYTESPDDSSDEPLSEIAKRVQSRPKRKASVVPSKRSTPVITSKRSAARKKGGSN